MTSKTRNLRYKDTRKNISKTQLGKLAEGLGLKKGLSPNQIKMAAGTMSQKVVVQALKRAGLGGMAVGTALDALLSRPASGATSKVRKESREPKATGSRLGKTSDIAKRLPTTHTVKKGDTFTSIAREKGTTVAKLKELNKVDPKKLQIGSKVKLR